MADPLFDAGERAQLCDLFGELGPEAPTLLARWTRDLATHLVLRMDEALWRNVSRAAWFLAAAARFGM